MTKLSSLRVRLVVWVTAVSLFGLVATGLITALAGGQMIRTWVDNKIAQEITEFRSLAERNAELSTYDLLHKAIAESVGGTQETLIGYLPGETLAPGYGLRDLARDTEFRAQATAHTQATFDTYYSPTLGEVRYAVIPITTVSPDPEPAGLSHFTVAYYVSNELSDMRAVLWAYLAASVVVLLAIAATTWMLASEVLRPLRVLRDTAADISASDISERIEVSGSDEVADLGHTFNDMLDRLKDSLDAQRNMLDDVGHELRTPITIVRGHLELLDVSDPADVASTRDLAIDELDRMNALVADLITLAKSHRPDFLNIERVDLSEVVMAALQRFMGAGDMGEGDSQISFQAGSLKPVFVAADRQRLLQATIQLIDNAVSISRANPIPGGHLITVSCDRLGRRAFLSVSDTGPGINPDELDNIFQRHVRGTDAYEGTGLGLAIVHAIATAHDGSVRVAKTGPEGTTMEISLAAQGDPR